MARSPNADPTPKNVPLSQDEWLLCLEVYLRHRGRMPKENARAIRELSESMRRIRAALAGPTGSFRQPTGVLRRVLEFKHLDEKHVCAPKPKLAREVWRAFGDKPHAEVARIAEAIKKCTAAKEVQRVDDADIAQNYHAVESRILTRVHAVRERNAAIVRRKKEKFQDENQGRLYCEACAFDFARRYPRHGDGYIECHHIKPLSELRPGDKTTLDDLALLCSNCHRMVHYRRPWLDMRGLEQALNRAEARW